MKQSLRDLAGKLGCHLLGDASVIVTNVSSLQSATRDSLVFVEDEQDFRVLPPFVEDAQHFAAPPASPAAAVIAGDFAGKFAAGAAASKPLLIASQPRLTFARAARLLRDPDRDRGIHPSAIVPATAELGNNVAIGARANLGEQVKIGDETTIGAGAVIGDKVAIGSHCRLDANVIIYPGTTLGDRVTR